MAENKKNVLEEKRQTEMRSCPQCCFEVTNPFVQRCPRCFSLLSKLEIDCAGCFHSRTCPLGQLTMV